VVLVVVVVQLVVAAAVEAAAVAPAAAKAAVVAVVAAPSVVGATLRSSELQELHSFHQDCVRTMCRISMWHVERYNITSLVVCLGHLHALVLSGQTVRVLYAGLRLSSDLRNRLSPVVRNRTSKCQMPMSRSRRKPDCVFCFGGGGGASWRCERMLVRGAIGCWLEMLVRGVIGCWFEVRAGDGSRCERVLVGGLI
jgi:hypothetical protein